MDEGLVLHRRENVDSRLQKSFQASVIVAHFNFVSKPVSLLFVFIQAVKHNGGTKETRTNLVANLYDWPVTIAFTGKCRKSWKTTIQYTLGQKFHNVSVTDGPPAKRIEKIEQLWKEKLLSSNSVTTFLFIVVQFSHQSTSHFPRLTTFTCWSVIKVGDYICPGFLRSTSLDEDK